jgi:hypothetical protein
MPLPMVHFAVAVQLGERSSQFPSAEFLLGSIAPDAIHMRPESQHRDKLITHLLDPADTPDHTQVRDLLAHYTAMPAPYPAFAAGYAAHVLTDRLWSSTITEPFYAQLPPDTDDVTWRKLYYQETDQIDCNLYHHMPWQPEVWSCLAQADSLDFLPLLSSSEIDLWRKRTLRWFEDPSHEPHVTPNYLTDSLVENFASRAARYVETHFYAWQIVDPFA